MDSFQAELRRSFFHDLRQTQTNLMLLQKPLVNDRFLSTWISYKNFLFFALLIFAGIVILSFMHSIHVYNSILESSLNEKSWIETYKIGALKLESNLDKLFLHQRDFLSGEIGRNTDKERKNIESTITKIDDNITALKQNRDQEYPALNNGLLIFQSRLKNWITFQNELDTWVKAGDPDTANALFFEKGQSNRLFVSEPFYTIQNEIERLAGEKTKLANERLHALKLRTYFFNSAWALLVSLMFLTYYKLNTLLTRFTDYLRRWIYNTSRIDKPEDTALALEGLRKNMFTLKSRLWGLRADERAPRTGQKKDAA